MVATHTSQPTLDSIAPRFVVGNLAQALAFYEQLGFATTYQDEAFAIVERDGIDLHLNPTGCATRLQQAANERSNDSLKNQESKVGERVKIDEYQ